MEAFSIPERRLRAPVPVIEPGHSYGSVTDKLTASS